MVDTHRYWLDASANPVEIAAVVTHRQIIAMDGEQSVTPAKVKAAIDSSEVGIVICRVDNWPCGYIAVRWLNPVCVKIAIGFLEPVRGWRAKQFVALFLDRLFKEGGVVKVTGEVGAWNLPCLRIAATMGFRREGVNTLSCLHEGHLHDQIYVGLTRRDWKDGKYLHR